MNDYIGNAYKAFFSALSHGGIEPIIHTVHNILGYPVILNDNSGSTLFQFPSTKLGDPDWDYSFEYRTIQREHYMNLYNSFISKPGMHNRPLHVKEGFLDERYQVIIIVSYRQQILGLISIIVSSPELSPDEYEVIEIFITAIRSELKRSYVGATLDSNRLTVILTETNLNSTTYQLALSGLSKLYTGNYQMLLVKTRSPLDLPLLDVISKDLNKNCQNSLSAIVDDLLVILLYRNPSVSDISKNALHILQAYPVHTAVSTVFLNIECAKDYLYQTRLTLKCGITLQADASVYHFIDFAPYQTIAAASENGTLPVIVDPLIQQIADYDTKNGTDYLLTLNVYLYCRQSKTATTQRLYIHQNTLTYRLKRMEELFNIDFEDGVGLQNLYGSIMILNFARGSAPEFTS